MRSTRSHHSNNKQQQQVASMTIVIRSTGGRLGNNMFQYASSLGIVNDMRQQEQKQQTQERHDPNADSKITFCMHPEFDLPLLEEAVVGPLIPKCQNLTSSSYYELDDMQYATRHEIAISQLCNSRADDDDSRSSYCTVALKGYYQSWKYFETYQATVRNIFQFQPAMQQQATDYMINLDTTAVAAAPIKIGIHVRRGDMSTNDFYLRDPPLSYYQNAMDYFADTYASIHYLIVSDDPDWCAQQHMFISNTNNNDHHHVTIVRHDDASNTFAAVAPSVDMAILSQCHHVITSRGSFGWWAAYLTNSKAIYYKDMFVLDHQENLGKVTVDDYYPSHWVGLGA